MVSDFLTPGVQFPAFDGHPSGGHSMRLSGLQLCLL